MRLAVLGIMTDPYDPTFNHHRMTGASPPSSALDEDRLASMADEGGVSGALMEIDDSSERKRLMQRQHRPGGFGRWRTATAVFALAGIALVAWGWLKRTT